MSIGIVDVLEVIDVDENHQHVALHSHRQLECLLRKRDEGATVGESGQLVDQQQGLELVLGALASGYVVIHRVDSSRLIDDAKWRCSNCDPQCVSVLVTS